MPKEGVGAMSPVLTRHIPTSLGAEESSRVCWAGAGHDFGILGWQERDADSNGLGKKTEHVRIDVAEQGTSREKQIQAGTAHAVDIPKKVDIFSRNWTQAEQRIL